MPQSKSFYHRLNGKLSERLAINFLRHAGQATLLQQVSKSGLPFCDFSQRHCSHALKRTSVRIFTELQLNSSPFMEVRFQYIIGLHCIRTFAVSPLSLSGVKQPPHTTFFFFLKVQRYEGLIPRITIFFDCFGLFFVPLCLQKRDLIVLLCVSELRACLEANIKKSSLVCGPHQNQFPSLTVNFSYTKTLSLRKLGKSAWDLFVLSLKLLVNL